MHTHLYQPLLYGMLSGLIIKRNLHCIYSEAETDFILIKSFMSVRSDIYIHKCHQNLIINKMNILGGKKTRKCYKWICPPLIETKGLYLVLHMFSFITYIRTRPCCYITVHETTDS